MSKLNVDQKTIFELLSDRKADFLIPDYQRPYAWDEEQCQTLWDDLFTFSFPHGFASYFPYFPARILGNCILLPIEAESQDTALRIFSTLNDRGLPLADADIFKAQFYKYYGEIDKKDDFISEWKNLEEITGSVFYLSAGAPMDELFARYMYFLRAKEGNKSTTTEALRKFYERNKYRHLKQSRTISDLKSLALLWKGIANQDKLRFSESSLRSYLF